ncbi:MAG: GTPase HflX [Gammaproteobacteria bacterium]|nr:GTPase HflX [Gammaproteobacteria bacterium]MCF6229699.1 GTPase HflX [Gammaproteobacteria bacterium]
MFERPKAGERAVLVHVDVAASMGEEDLNEFHELVVSAGAEPVAIVTGARRTPDAKYYIGSGKAEEIAQVVLAEGADVVLFNHALAPSQERNLEAILKCRVLDRTGLILDIFAQRADSHEGRLQVELAQLKHLSTRLIRGWTHLERQKGGIGLRGPGETQLETDRRLLNERIKQLRKRLEKVQRRREQSRKARKKAELPTISLVGYTNAGKSTLFNSLTDSGVYAADQLFATLDPTFRRLELPQAGAAIIADTVGFIRHLPHDLVAAFQSTLEESRNAALLLHVIDSHSVERHAMIEQVNLVLKEIGASEVPQIEIFNKIDLLEGEKPRIDRDEHGNVRRIWVSAQADLGMELILEAVAEQFRDQRIHHWLNLPADAGRLRARLFELEAVRSERFGEQGEWHLEIELEVREFELLKRQKLLDDEMVLADHP